MTDDENDGERTRTVYMWFTRHKLILRHEILTSVLSSPDEATQSRDCVEEEGS